MSVLIAAGIAVYENPQVRQWVDTSRRKIAIALHSLGDEIGPRPPTRRSPPDPSTRPDDSPEAVERRRQARQEILERGRALQEKRNRQKKSHGKASESFDNLVDKNGSLINEKEEARTTAADTKPQPEDQDLRRRNIEVDATLLGSTAAPPPPPSPLPMSPALSSRSALVVDTERISNHSSEALIDLTPTTSNSSAANVELPSPPRFPDHQDPSWSVHEWAENSSSSFYSPSLEGQSTRMGSDLDEESPSHGESNIEVRSLSHVGTDSDMESDDGQTIGTCTPGSWSEIGSVVSEDF